MTTGAYFLPSGEIKFRVWAPKAKTLSLVIGKEKPILMNPQEQGYYEVIACSSNAEMDYFFNIDGDKIRPDPASRWQPYGVHGASRVYNAMAYQWGDIRWKGIPLTDYIIYELHTGTFTSEGTFESIIPKLKHLKELGITAIELMPVVEFPGSRNWGYDGVYPYAPHHAYGGPDGLKRLVDMCHQIGLAVVLDVVYNHLGPEGNYLGDFGYYFTDRYKTPWGLAINCDGPYSDPVRRYFIDNALYWLTEYHIDALRLDAIGTIYDLGSKHILKEIWEAFHQQARVLGRQAYIIAESDLNDVRLINPVEKGGYGLDAQWNDDFHHAMHALLTGCRSGYFKDFGEQSHLAKALQEGFVHNGQWVEFRNRKYGSDSKNIPGEKFVVFLQNHDQIGNASEGKRLSELVTEEQYKLAAAVLLCAPNIPLLFMGQEWKTKTPFLFFTSFIDKDLAESVREGYRREHSYYGHMNMLDPQEIAQFSQSKLCWQELDIKEHNSIFEYYQTLIRLRKKVSCLSDYRKDLVNIFFKEKEQWMIITRGEAGGSKVILIVNFAAEIRDIATPFSIGEWSLRLFSSSCNWEMPDRINLKEPAVRKIKVPAYTAILFEGEA